MQSGERNGERYALGLGWLAAVLLSGVGFSASETLPFVNRVAVGVALGLAAFAAIYYALRVTRRD